MRTAPQPGFSVAILAISPCSSWLIRGRPWCRARRFHVQYARHAVRCQRMTVSGCTITRVECQPDQYPESHDQKRRSAGCVRSLQMDARRVKRPSGRMTFFW